MNVAILGVGPFGQRLAGACADTGLSVAVYGADANDVLDIVDAIGVDDAGAHVDGTTDLPGAVGEADVVVETRSASVETTRERLAAVENHAPDDALLAFKADERPVTETAVALQTPGRFVGLHEIHGGQAPAEAVPLEVVRADQTTDDTVETARTFVSDIGWIPLVVGDGPGFVSSRLHLALQAEAIRLLEDGVGDAETIDRTMTLGYSHDLGPLELADRQGLDTVEGALSSLADTLGHRYEPPPLLTQKVEDGDYGKRRGRGFYVWDGDTPTSPASDE